jgi:SUKH-3 immunity protein
MLWLVSPRFSAMTAEYLTGAGWRPGRTGPMPPETEAELRTDGHELLPSARAFLEEFGDLTVVHPHFRVACSLDSFVIDPLLAARGRDPAGCAITSAAPKSALTPIGEASRGYPIICMGAGGAVYGGYDDVLLRLGASGDDTLEAL